MMKWQEKAFQNALQGFRDYFQGSQGLTPGATQQNPQAVYGAPGEPMTGAPSQLGGGQQQQQNPLLSQIMGGLGGIGRNLRMGLQGMGRGIGNIGQNLGGMLGINQRPQAGGYGVPGMMRGMANLGGGEGQMGPLANPMQGGLDPRILNMLRQLLGGGISGLPQDLLSR
jgi:hypothetical protein